MALKISLMDDFQNVFGVLHFPDNYDASRQYPLVIASHAHQLRDHRSPRANGRDYLVFAIHPFDSRDVSSTVGNQINVTSETVIYEMAQTLIVSRIQVDNKTTGWSLGGTASLFNGWIHQMKFDEELTCRIFNVVSRLLYSGLK